MEKYGLQRAIFSLILMLLLICTANEGFCSEKGESRGKLSSIQISGSGSSADDPIAIQGASNSKEGVRIEYTILAKRFPKSSQVSQHLIHHKNRPMDVIRIRLANGTERDVFFDVSNFFGKTASVSVASAECTVNRFTSIFKDKTSLQYVAGLKQDSFVKTEIQRLAKEGKITLIQEGVKVESLKTEKIKGADVIKIRILNRPNAPGTWWILGRRS